MVVRWSFEDPVTTELHVFSINPNTGGTPQFKKNITAHVTTAPDGAALLFEGRKDVERGEFKGIVRTEQEYDDMLYWFNKTNQIYMTDDLGRLSVIYITDLQLQRERAVQMPWKHSYTVQYTVLDWI